MKAASGGATNTTGRLTSQPKWEIDMANANDTSKSRPARNFVTGAEPEPARQLIEAIEAERARLMKAESILHCAIVAMTHDDDFDDGETPYYPSVLEEARDLVNQALEQLDSVRVGPMIEKLKGQAGKRAAESGSDYPGVREPRAEYRTN